MPRGARLVVLLVVPALVIPPAACPVAAQERSAAEERLLDTITARRVEPDGRFAQVARWTAPGRPSLALALSGGGAHGVAHLGVIEALQQDGVEIDGIAGTSIGALLGAFLCAGYPPEEVEEILRGHDWDAIISGLDLRNRVLSETEDVRQSSPLIEIRLRRHKLLQVGALLESRLLERELYRYLLKAQLDSGGDLDRLRYRYRPVATDILSGKAVVAASGDLVSLVRGSFAIPGVLRPVPVGGALLVDGGLVENVPVMAARSMGTDEVLAVDVTEALRPTPGVKGALDLLNRSITLMMDARTRESLALADLVVTPEVREFPASDFSGHVLGLAQAGRDAYERQRQALWALLESRAGDRAPIAYDGLEVRGTTWITPEEIGLRLGGGSGTVTRFRVAAELARALNLGPFASGHAAWIGGPAGRRLRFVFEENPTIRAVVRHGVPEPPRGEAGPPSPIGQPFSLEAARTILARTREDLIDRGRGLVNVDAVLWDPGTGTVTLDVSEATVGRITTEVQGEIRLERTERFLEDLQGERFRFDGLADRLDEMVARGAIFDWSLRAGRTAGGEVELRTQVRGDDYFEGAVGAAYRGAFGWAGFLRTAKANITGRGDFVDLTLTGARETALVRARYRTEYGAGFQNLGAEVGADYFDRAFPLVDDRQNLLDETEEYRGDRAWISFIRRLRWGAVAQAGMSRERDHLDPADGAPEERLGRTSVFLKVNLDRHDRLLFPTRGGSLAILAERSVSGDPLWKSEMRVDTAFSTGIERRHTVTLGMGLGLSEDADRRPFWFNPGGYRDLYGFIPYGAAAPQYALAGATWRLRLFDIGAARLYLEAGVDVVRTALRRGDLGSAGDTVGYGASLIAHTRLLGPIALGAARNDAGAGMIFLTAGFPFLNE